MKKIIIKKNKQITQLLVHNFTKHITTFQLLIVFANKINIGTHCYSAGLISTMDNQGLAT